MTNTTPTLDFDRMSLAAGGHIRTALLHEHRVLTCMASYFDIFVIANTDDTDRAREVADELHTRHNGLRSIYLVLITDEQMTAITDPGIILNTTVYLVEDNYAPAATAIRLHDGAHLTLDTEHGTHITEITTTRELRTGDFYTCGTERVGSGNYHQAVYRARADYDPTTGEVRHHLVNQGYNPRTGERTGALTDGPDCIVFRLTDPEPLRNRLNLDDIRPVNA